MVEFDNEDRKSCKLTATEKDNLRHISKRLLEMADMLFEEPFDPKIATQLRMAADLADEQEKLCKYYTYPKDNEESNYKQDEKISETPPSKITDEDIYKGLGWE